MKTYAIIDSQKYSAFKFLEPQNMELRGTFSVEDAIMDLKSEKPILYAVNCDALEFEDLYGLKLLKSLNTRAQFLMFFEKTNVETISKLRSYGFKDFMIVDNPELEHELRLSTIYEEIHSKNMKSNKDFLHFSDDENIVSSGSAMLTLGPQEFEVLKVLHNECPGLVTREEILNRIDTKSKNNPRILDVFVCNLRKKISKLNINIHTVRNTGFRLEKFQEK